MSALNKVRDFFSPLFDTIDEHFRHFQPLTRTVNSVGLRPAHIILPFFLLAVVTLGTGMFSNLFVALFGMIYPVYMTFRVLSSLRRPSPATTRKNARSG
jgi:hypothetical protein